MEDNSSDKGLLTRISPPLAVRTLGRVGKRGVLKVGRRVQQAGQQLARRVAHELIQPEQIVALQSVLASVAQWGMERGFKLDPNAGLFFEFLDWLDQEQGRDQVMQRLMISPMFQDPAFLEALSQAAAALSPFMPTETRGVWGSAELEHFKQRGGDKLLDLLVTLVALHQDTPPPTEASAPRRQSFVEDSTIPERFKVLAQMALGDALEPPGEAAATKAIGTLRALRGRLAGPTEPQAPLTRFVPGVGDPHLHFLVYSTTFVMQSYLLRHLVESLPEMAARLRELHPHDTDPQR
ncbi:hypothetical protein DL240_05125 [Lujinxingia litoralis]|uniref:Uncharacterized protein n=1 Tax=Lujinxingia litoralis TaxID=2211119 RepID=A0A328C972_9DELT|nr:hypothetical protein [Lujinxingia litoralis]RAL23544.1 hypothetical protein DL240_05125 [Lujinxingia litoralis]